MRLIDADVLIENMKKAVVRHICTNTLYNTIMAVIDGAPTIEPTGDLISRQDAIDAFSDVLDSDFPYISEVTPRERIENIPSAPSAEAEQVTGKLNKRDDSLLTDDSDGFKEQKSKLDLISRQDAIEAIRKFQTYKLFKKDNMMLVDQAEVMTELMMLPSAPDNRQHGEWQGYNADDPDWTRKDGTPIFMVCDQCHETVLNTGSAHWHYCPNCGAMMLGEDGEA